VGIRDFSQEVKQQGHGIYHSSTTGAKVKKMWTYISIPPYAFTAQCLVKHRVNFALSYSIQNKNRYIQKNL
jgi:hypothetical protein